MANPQKAAATKLEVPMQDWIQLFYITCPDQDAARKISQTLLQEGLIACANILPGMESIYWWEGQIQSATEVVLILKSTSAQSDRIIARVESLHPYNTPCILALPVEKGSEPYIRYLKGSLY
jgi:periplasmic divalent cation tolerance protein